MVFLLFPPYDPIIEEVPEGMTKEDIRVEVLAGKRCWNTGGTIINGKSDKLDINGLEMEAAKKAVANWLERNEVWKKMYHL